MNNLVYVGIVVLIVILAAVAYYGYSGSLSGAGSGATTAQTTATTFPYSTNVTTTATSTASYSGACSAYNGYECKPATCTASSGYTCSNATYVYSSKNGTAYLLVSISQESGQIWSGFGTGFAPKGTTFVGGTPMNVTFYNANASSSNVGTQLNSNVVVKVISVDGLKGKGLNATPSGGLWACYTNSGVLYVGSAGCTITGGGSAIPTYVEIANISVT